MLDINRLATEAAEESEITWKEAEARALEPTKKILELLIIPPNHQSPPSLQSTERSKRDLTEHMRSKGEQLSSQLLSGIIDKFPEGLDILSEASTRSHVEAAVYVNDPLLGVFREAFTAVTGNKDFVNPVSASTSATSIFLSYPPASKKKTSVVDPNSVPDSNSVPSITELDGWTSRLLKKQKWARTYIADVWPVQMRIPYRDSKAESSPTYIRHTFGANGKVRSIIGQAIMFQYTGTSAPGRNARLADR
jgi:hypothetical protein